MQEGYFINFKTDKSVMVQEHFSWIQQWANAKSIGVPEHVFQEAAGIKDRNQHLTYILSHAPLIRVRGYGVDISFEYSSHMREDVMWAIWTWGKNHSGPYTWFDITNITTHEHTGIRFDSFEESMKAGGSESVMRVAKEREARNAKLTAKFETDKQASTALSEIKQMI